MSAVTSDQRQQGVATGSRPPLPVPRPLLRMRSDSALAERVTAGDEAAFDVLYERHRAVVLAVAMGVLGTTHDAEDATQETFSALALALRTKPPAELRPWLIRVARNAAIDTTRRRRHRLLTIDGEIPETQARPIGGGKAELAVVFDGIRELPEGQRMALLMRELGGHTYTEIAEFLETDEEAVKGLIARARVGLRAFREATELPCASARATIAAEPDGRRYDKTIRRHLRACASCRSYRGALRDDAKALRAGLPLQAGGVASTGIAGGSLAAAKGAVLGYGLTQTAAACAASACAVGAVGGMVLMTPVHRFGIPAILPAAKHAQPQATGAVRSARRHIKATGTHVSSHAGTIAVSASDLASYTHRPKTAVKPATLKHHRSVAVKQAELHLTPSGALNLTSKPPAQTSTTSVTSGPSASTPSGSSTSTSGSSTSTSGSSTGTSGSNTSGPSTSTSGSSAATPATQPPAAVPSSQSTDTPSNDGSQTDDGSQTQSGAATQGDSDPASPASTPGSGTNVTPASVSDSAYVSSSAGYDPTGTSQSGWQGTWHGSGYAQGSAGTATQQSSTTDGVSTAPTYGQSAPTDETTTPEQDGTTGQQASDATAGGSDATAGESDATAEESDGLAADSDATAADSSADSIPDPQTSTTTSTVAQPTGTSAAPSATPSGPSDQAASSDS